MGQTQKDASVGGQRPQDASGTSPSGEPGSAPSFSGSGNPSKLKRRSPRVRTPEEKRALNKEYQDRHAKKPQRIANRRAFQAKRKDEFRALIARLKLEMGSKCAICPRTTALHFAHIDRTTKLFNVADFANVNKKFSRIEAEARKCRLLCRTHHIEETKQQYASKELRWGPRKPTPPQTGITKICSFCRQTLDLCEFSPGNGAFQRQTACRACLRDYTNKRNAENRVFIESFKKQCLDCGGTSFLDFDHVRGTKHREVSKMLSYKRERIIEEIAKCDVVCTECHAVRTALRKKEKAP